MSKSMVVTGVGGFIGRYVAEEGLKRGYRVTGVDQKDSSGLAIEYVRADIRDGKRMADVLRGKDYVVHLAAVTSNVEFTKDYAGCYETNVNGFFNVIDGAVKGGCKRMVYASSAAVYQGQCSEDAVIDFRSQRNHYAKTKMMNEMMAQSYSDIYGLSTTGLRYFNVYGDGEDEKGDYASIVGLFLKAQGNGEALTVYEDGQQARDLINVVDAAWVTLNVLEEGAHSLYNVGTGIATSYTKIARMIGDCIRYVPNPLSNYQRYTRAETKRLAEIVGGRRLIALEAGIAQMGGGSGVRGA